MHQLSRLGSRFLVLFAALAACSTSLAAEKQAGQLQALHRAGQTFLTWQDEDWPVLDAAISMADLHKAIKQVQPKKIRYRVYRSEQAIRSTAGLTPIAEVGPLSCWNPDFYGGDARPDQKAFRYVIEEGQEPLAPGTGLYVHSPRHAGNAYYAVTVAIDGKEKPLDSANSLAKCVQETVGQGLPVLQRVEKPKEFQYVSQPTAVYFYVRWEAPPNCSVEGKPFDYLVAIPPKPVKPTPVGIHLHCWGGSLLGGYGWWYNAEKGSMMLASNQIPYDWWTGYHESYWKVPRSQKAWQEGVVHPYSQTRMLSFLEWMATKWDVDLKRTHVAGSSMGGSGSPMFAIRYPEFIAWGVSWVGVHTPAKTPQFKGSYANSYGEPEWQVKFEDGTPVWDYFDDTWYLRKHPEKEIGLITFSNGKNDGGIGWPQAAEFFRALQETKRPHIFVWGQSGHGQRASMPITLAERVMPIDIRTDQTLPAFTHCSLDDNPGSGDPKEGDAKGQANLYLYWETEDIVDKADQWGMAVGLITKAPKDDGTVDITPRRCQQFKPRSGTKVAWTNSVAGEIVQRGQAQVDALGLVTLEKVHVSKAKHRIQVSPQG